MKTEIDYLTEISRQLKQRKFKSYRTSMREYYRTKKQKNRPL